MQTILFIGKVNEIMKNLNEFLSGSYRIQLCPESAEVMTGMLKITKPDLVLISLVGAYDLDRAIFTRLQLDYPDIPVLTIGTEGEREVFLQFYEGEQFENLIRPLENTQVRDAIERRLGTAEKTETNRKKRVLIVDDNAATLRSIKAMLEDRYEISVANSGMKAMTSIGKRCPDLILLDYEMPVCDGKQTLEMIRADEELADIPVIFLTGVNDRAHIEAVLGLHPSGYLLKPAVRETLIEKIGQVLSERERQEEL